MNRKNILLLAIAFVIIAPTIIHSRSATNDAPLTGTITGTVSFWDSIIPIPTPTATPIVTPTPIPTPAPVDNDTTIAYLGDARPSKFGTLGITELTADFNQVIPQSPTGKIDAIFMIGDMDHVSQAMQAYQASNVNTAPLYWVVGNHEIDNNDMTYLKGLPKPTTFHINVGPTGTEKTTFSVDVGKIHVVNMNEYWDEGTNDAWFKYGGGDGGYIGTKLMSWISSDLSNTSKWKIVLGHEPLYPKQRHVGDSLDKNITNRDALQNLFISKNVKVFIGAHTHFSTVNKVGAVYHVDAGISGQKTVDGEDPYASITYTIANSTNMTLIWKHENPTWSTPKVTSYIIS